MSTKTRAVAAVLLAVAVVSTGCWVFRSPLSREKLRGAEAVVECQDAYKSVYRAYKAKLIDEAKYQEGRKLYSEAQKVAPDLYNELEDATAEGDKRLAAPGRKQKVDDYIAKLEGLARKMRDLIPTTP